MYMSGRLSKFHSVHTYVIPRTVILSESVYSLFYRFLRLSHMLFSIYALMLWLSILKHISGFVTGFFTRIPDFAILLAFCNVLVFGKNGSSISKTVFYSKGSRWLPPLRSVNRKTNSSFSKASTVIHCIFYIDNSRHSCFIRCSTDGRRTTILFF